MRREKAKPLEVELDLSGKFHRKSMAMSSLENEKKRISAVSEKFKQKEDVEMYIQLPDYGDFQGYDLGPGDTLNQVGRKIYANFRKPSWQTLKHHLFSAKVTKKLFREIKANGENDKKGDSEQERMFGRVIKIHIVNTFSELVEMDFADYGDLVTFLRIRDTFSRFSAIAF